MASEKVTRILVSRGAPFTDEQLAALSESEAWAWVYANREPPKRPARTGEVEICFTGFDPGERGRLETAARRAGMLVRSRVTKHLTLLCTGPEPGPAKLAAAQEQGVRVIDLEGFNALLPR